MSKRNKTVRKRDFLNNQENDSHEEREQDEERIGYNDMFIHFIN